MAAHFVRTSSWPCWRVALYTAVLSSRSRIPSTSRCVMCSSSATCMQHACACCLQADTAHMRTASLIPMHQPGMNVSAFSHCSANVSSAQVPATSSQHCESSQGSGAMYTRVFAGWLLPLACNKHTGQAHSQACTRALTCCRAAAAAPYELGLVVVGFSLYRYRHGRSSLIPSVFLR